MLTTSERFDAKIDKSGECWIWTACTNHAGYGLFRDGEKKKNVIAHRYAWEREHGPIPPGLTVDHVRARGCTRTDCMRVEHMELVTMAENLRRRHALRTTCPQGHPYDAVDGRGYRFCRGCRNANDRARRAAKRTAA